MSARTEFEFTLLKGYVDDLGNLHKEGTMRLATAADEILPLRDPRVQQNPAYSTIIVLSRVVVRLGNLEVINPKIIEDMFSTDFAYLQSFYNRINNSGSAAIKAVCPQCGKEFEAGNNLD